MQADEPVAIGSQVVIVVHPLVLAARSPAQRVDPVAPVIQDEQVLDVIPTVAAGCVLVEFQQCRRTQAVRWRDIDVLAEVGVAVAVLVGVVDPGAHRPPAGTARPRWYNPPSKR